jgi:hypothetical protein
MTRFARYSMFALVLVALSSPMFAFCTSCAADFSCEWTPDSGTHCIEHIDYCEEFSSSCTGVADQGTLTGQLTVAAVEVTTPNGMSTSGDTPRVAEQNSPVNTFTAQSTR